MKFNPEILNRAFNQIYAEQVLAGDKAERRAGALEKALVEIRENKTISFKNDLLFFVSRYSGKPRRVTSAGCVGELCECGNQFSYHRGIYLVCEKYAKLMAKEEQTETIEAETPSERFYRDAYRIGFGDGYFQGLTEGRLERFRRELDDQKAQEEKIVTVNVPAAPLGGKPLRAEKLIGCGMAITL